MSYPPDIWNQLKGLTADKIISALIKDGFILDADVRTERVYRHPNGAKVTIHYHTGSRTYSPSLLKALLADIGWTVPDMKRLKLVR